MISKTAKRILTILSVIFVLLFGYLLVLSIVATRYKQLEGMVVWDTLAAVTFFILMVFLLSKRVISWVDHWLSNKWVLILFFVGVYAMHFLIARALSVNPLATSWDPQTMYQGSLELLKAHHLTSQASYFVAFPNNLAILHLETFLLLLAQHIGMAHHQLLVLVSCNVLILDSTLFLAYQYAKRFFGAAASIYTLVLGLVFIALSPWSRTFYTDTVGMLFPVLSLWIVTLLISASSLQKRISYAALLGFVAGIGLLIKPTTISVLVAAVIVLSLGKLSNRQHRVSRSQLRASSIIAMILIVFVGLTYSSLNWAMDRSAGIHPSPMPPSHFAMMGLTKVCTPLECRYGAWNYNDAIKPATFTCAKAYKAYTFKEIKLRLERYGIAGYLSFVSQKGAWIIGDGTFYAYHEGTGATAPLLHRGPLSKHIQLIMHPSGKYYSIFQNAMQALWIMVLLFMVLPLNLKRVSLSRPLLYVGIIRVSVLGLLIFLLLFEARSRYVYLYVPLFILLAGYNFMSLQERLKAPSVLRRTSKVRD